MQGSSSPSSDLTSFGELVVITQDNTTQMRGNSTLTLYRTPTQETESPGLTGTWPGQVVPLLLAAIGSADIDHQQCGPVVAAPSLADDELAPRRASKGPDYGRRSGGQAGC